MVNEDFAMYQRGKEKNYGNNCWCSLTTLISDKSRVYSKELHGKIELII
jgi:hypothetical protein